jgi:HEAT repeat protein
MVVEQAAAAMSAIGPAAVPYLAGALPGASPEVRSHLLLALGKLGPAAAPASPAIMEVLVTGEDRNTPLQAAQTLRRIGPLALPAMVAGLSRTNVGAGERIEAALAELAADQPDAFTALEAELRKAPPAFRPALLRAVQQVTLYPKRRGLIVARTLTDPDPALRAAAADWLRRNSSPVELERPLASEPEALRRLVEEVFRTNRVSAAVEPK